MFVLTSTVWLVSGRLKNFQEYPLAKCALITLLSLSTLQSQSWIIASPLLEISLHACFTNILHNTNAKNPCKSYCNLDCMKFPTLLSPKPVLCVNCGLNVCQFYQNVNKDLLWTCSIGIVFIPSSLNTKDVHKNNRNHKQAKYHI